MDIVLSLRPTDIKSALPEASVSISGVALAGTLRIDAEVIPEYPFLGKSTVGFFGSVNY